MAKSAAGHVQYLFIHWKCIVWALSTVVARTLCIWMLAWGRGFNPHSVHLRYICWFFIFSKSKFEIRSLSFFLQAIRGFYIRSDVINSNSGERAHPDLIKNWIVRRCWGLQSCPLSLSEKTFVSTIRTVVLFTITITPLLSLYMVLRFIPVRLDDTRMMRHPISNRWSYRDISKATTSR